MGRGAMFFHMDNKQLSEEQLNSLPRESLVAMYRQLLSGFEELESQNADLLKRLTGIEESLALQKLARFGRKTEKSSEISGQMAIDFNTMCVINEAEILIEDKEVSEPEMEQVTISRPKHNKQKGKRDIDLSGIPVKQVPHTLTDEALKEIFPDGYKILPDEVYRELEMHPAWFEVLEHHVAVYVSKKGDEFARADKPGRLMGSGSIATPSLLAGIINGKYGNANPFNRMSAAFLSHDVNIPPQNMANWCIKSADTYFKPIFELMHEEMIGHSRLIHADESFFKVTEDIRERGPNARSYMWLYHTDTQYGSHPIFLYEYCPTRKSENPENFLAGYSGILMTDGFQAYHKLANEHPDELKVAGCWSHCKRRYADLVKAVSTQNARGTVAFEANERIAAIYHVDNMYKGFPPEERLKYRQSTVKPLADAFFEYLKNVVPAIDRSSETGKAVAYSLNQEKYLREFLNDPIIPLDNNDAERSIRTFCVGRANWHIINSKSGAAASGILYSMTETAKANGLKVFDYLRYILGQMKDTPNELWTHDFLENLLPWSDAIPADCKVVKTR